MSLSAGELRSQLPDGLLKIAGEAPVIGPVFKAIEILRGINQGTLADRRHAAVISRLNELEKNLKEFSQNPGVVLRSADWPISDEQIDLAVDVQQLVVGTASKEKRIAAARILFFSTLQESNLEFSLASRMLKDLGELEEFHLHILRVFGLQADKAIAVNVVPPALQDVMEPVLFHKALADLVKLGFVVISDGTWARPHKTEYLDTFVSFILQDIQS